MLIVEDTVRLTTAAIRSQPCWPEVVEAGKVAVTIQRGDGPTTIEVKLASGSTPNGGTRRWLCCPVCGHGRTYLLVHDGKLECRCCMAAVYLQQSFADSRWRTQIAIPLLRQLRKQRGSS